ncbi:cation-translocating P-type ATPase [soil metagenome]
METEEETRDLSGAESSLREAGQIARELGVDPAAGLGTAEAKRRLEADGPNELRGIPRVPAWLKFIAQFRDPLVYLLLTAAVISLAAWLVEGADGPPIDAMVIAAIVLLSGLLGYVQEARADDAVAALAAMTAASDVVLRGGELMTVPSSELVRGDILALSEGDAVGADSRLLSASGLRVAQASLTGESEAVTKNPGTLPGPVSLGDRHNMVYKGTAVAQGVGRAIVTATGMDTEMGAIARMLDATTEEPTPLQIEINRLGKVLGVIVVVIAIVVVLTIIVVNGVSAPSDFVLVLLLGVSLAVAAVPEGLSAILSVVLAIGVQRMAKRHAIVKKLNSVEALGSASVICTDKTGTLTRNEMTIERVLTASGRADVTGVGYRPDGEVLSTGHPFSDADADAALLAETRWVLGGGSLSNNAQLTEHDGQWSIQGDPTEAAFLVAAHKLPGAIAHIDRFARHSEIPFTSERKLMTTVQREKNDGSVLLFTKGAPDVLLRRCTRLQRGGEVVPLTEELRQRAVDDIEALTSEAFRTLAVAYREVDHPVTIDTEFTESVENDLIYAGVVGIIDPPRAEAAAAIAEAHRAGIRIIMITGDHPATAARIAADLGIIESGGRAVTGAELDALGDEALRATTREVSVYARVSPKHKLLLVDALQADGEVVAMTGDGVNDAPALKSADIGVAMGITGTEVTKDAARMILADDNFATIIAAVRQGRTIFDNIKKFLRYLLSSNMGEVLTVFLGVVFAGFLGLSGASGEAIALPLLSTQILWINLVTDSGPALAMGVDPEIDDVMVRRPRSLHDRAIDGHMWGGILSIGLVMAVVTLFAIDLFLPGGLVEGTDSLAVARTAGFTTLVLAQLFNTLNARSETTSAFRGLFANKWLWGAILLGVVLQIVVVETPFLQAAFGTAPLDLAHWGWCVALASVVLWFDEIRKIVLRWFTRRNAAMPSR